MERSAQLLEACRAQGLDPTALGMGEGSASFTSSNSTEIDTVGSDELIEEQSTSKTYGFVFEQPFSEDFDLSLSATRFEIEVTDSINQFGSQYPIDQCYGREGVKDFCDFFTRNEDGKIDSSKVSFVNVGALTAEGYDFNLYYGQEFSVAEKSLRVTADIQGTKMTENGYRVFETEDDNVGETDVPEWRATGRIRLQYDGFSFNWSTRFIGGGREDWLDNPEFNEFSSDNVGCEGLFDADGNPIKCREVGFTDDYFSHSASLSYRWDNYYFTLGARNIFNDRPPKVDEDGVWSNHNIPLGVGYSTPRSYYLRVEAAF